MSKKEVYESLVIIDGVLGVVVVDPHNIEPADYDWNREHLLQCIKIAQVSSHGFVEIRIGDMGGRKEPRVIVCIFPKYHVAVEVESGHSFNKSIHRTLRRLGRRHCGLEVESRSCPPSKEPPAASSSEEIPF